MMPEIANVQGETKLQVAPSCKHTINRELAFAIMEMEPPDPPSQLPAAAGVRAQPVGLPLAARSADHGLSGMQGAEEIRNRMHRQSELATDIDPRGNGMATNRPLARREESGCHIRL
jgi:hypothetical protein